MYHRIVASKCRGVFRDINDGKYQPMLDSLAPRFTYRFYGDHALSGERTTRAAMEEWWARIYRLLPGARFTPKQILVTGWPWATRIAMLNEIDGPLPDGSRYRNTLAQFMFMRWGKIVEIHTLEDTQTLARALDVVAAAGNEEAHAKPITDA